MVFYDGFLGETICFIFQRTIENDCAGELGVGPKMVMCVALKAWPSYNQNIGV